MKAIKLSDGEYYAVITKKKKIIKTWFSIKYHNPTLGILCLSHNLYTPKELIGKKIMIKIIPYKRKQKKCQT